MVVAQIIDSLEVGGAESMAVSLANAISTMPGHGSVLVISRRGGELESQLDKRVVVVHLAKKGRLDFASLIRLRHVFLVHRVNVVHAHSTSFFLPWLLRLIGGPILVWHDHYGGQLPKNGLHPYMRKVFLRNFDHVFCASEKLCMANRKLIEGQKKGPAIEWLPNFSSATASADVESSKRDQKHILHLANFRSQKDHITFLEALALLRRRGVVLPQVTLAGFVYEADYFAAINARITALDLSEAIHVVTNQHHVAPLLQNAGIGVVSSTSEGLPVTLIEYGLFGLAVVVTEVGEIPHVVSPDRGWICPVSDVFAMATALQEALEQDDVRKQKAAALHEFIQRHFNPVAIMKRLTDTYQHLLSASSHT